MIEKLGLRRTAIAEALPEVSIQTRVGTQRDYSFIMNFSEEEQQLVLKQPVTDLETNEHLVGAITLAPYEVRIVYHPLKYTKKRTIRYANQRNEWSFINLGNASLICVGKTT